MGSLRNYAYITVLANKTALFACCSLQGGAYLNLCSGSCKFLPPCIRVVALKHWRRLVPAKPCWAHEHQPAQVLGANLCRTVSLKKLSTAEGSVLGNQNGSSGTVPLGIIYLPLKDLGQTTSDQNIHSLVAWQ